MDTMTADVAVKEAVAVTAEATEAIPVTALPVAEVIQKPRKKREPKPEPTPEQLAKLEALRHLKRRSPEEWERLVTDIVNQDVRTRVGCIVWWDYFAQRDVCERWPHLDRFLAEAFPLGHEADIDPNSHDVMNALVSIGYLKDQALERVWQMDKVDQA